MCGLAGKCNQIGSEIKSQPAADARGQWIDGFIEDSRKTEDLIMLDETQPTKRVVALPPIDLPSPRLLNHIEDDRVVARGADHELIFPAIDVNDVLAGLKHQRRVEPSVVYDEVE